MAACQRYVIVIMLCAGCYLAAENKLKLEHHLVEYGLLTGRLQNADMHQRDVKDLFGIALSSVIR